MGHTIQKIAGVQKNTHELYRAEKVIFVIITGGEENASREYSSQKVKQMVARQKARYGWEFVFLGAAMPERWSEEIQEDYQRRGGQG